MINKPDWRIFNSSQALAKALAEKVAAQLGRAIEERGQAFLAVSGGTTPKLFFQVLSQQNLEWSRVTVTLVDERFVPETSPRSNAALVRSMLLTADAASACFEPLYRRAENVEQAAATASTELAVAAPWPLDVAILGMGTDGHTASFFPDASELEVLLDPAGKALVLPVHSHNAGEARLTLSLARLLEADWLALHIEGDDKRAVLEKALIPGNEKPVSAIFAHTGEKVPVYWAS